MKDNLYTFVTERRLKGVPWPHIANMAGTSMDAMRPFMAMSAVKEVIKEEPPATVAKAITPVERFRSLVMPEAARKIAAQYGLTVQDLKGPKTSQRYSIPRHHLMWLLSQDPNLSTTMIGAFLGGRDHTTVCGGIKRHYQRMKSGC